MRDYARKLQSSKEKITSKIKQVVKFLLFFVRMILLLLFVGTVALLFIWMATPHFLIGNSNQNFVFILKDSCSGNRQIYYAFFDAVVQEIQPFLLTDSYFVQVVRDEKPRAIDQVELSEYFSSYLDSGSSTINYSWLMKQLIQQELELNVECDGLLDQTSQDNLSLLVIESLQKDMFQNLSQLPEKLRIWLLFKVADWKEIKTSEDAIPSLSSSSGCSIAVLNGTEISGYAQLLSSILESSGYRVVRVDSSLDKSESSIIAFSKKEECEQLGLKLSDKLFDGFAQLTQSDDITQRYRADLVILLGEEDIPLSRSVQVK
ncbi:MAG: hypothetical protein XD95_0321 [Microgenomates bacterium 39_7]|nr:MAG: hypothetical protein XD95_0321 [Microgenomates bacterium 39_7]